MTHREFLGRVVREIWIQWAREQPNPKPSWLVPWDELPEPDREVDRRIGERLYALGVQATIAARHGPTDEAAVVAERESPGERFG